MTKKIEISYIPIDDEAKWNEAFIDILSDGLYEYLKDQGLLKECPKRKRQVEALLEETKALTEPPVEQVDTSATLSINPEQSRRVDSA
jgi:hypothetical protein